jgi:hypothetical protein
MSGVDVKIMVMARASGNPIPGFAGNTFILDVISAGARVFMYEKVICMPRPLVSIPRSAPSARPTSTSAASASRD